MMHFKKRYIILICIAFISGIGILLSFQEQETPTFPESNASAKVLLPSDRIIAGRPLVLDIETDAIYPQLLLEGSYGTTILLVDIESIGTTVIIPESYTKHAGMLQYTVIENETILDQGSFYVHPDTSQLAAIENYVGPRSIMANERDYSMLVSIPTDHLDNMLPDGTTVNINTHFKETTTPLVHELKNNIAWQRIPAPLQSGRITIAGTLQDVSSKELVIDVFPDIATDFTITTDRIHPYADGNEVMTLQSSQIKDTHGNVISDGTLVTFYIKDSLGRYWETTGSTIQGYAFAKALHPQIPSSWTIKAGIEGIAQSDPVKVTFDSFLKEIPVTSSKNGQEIVVGPITSYLGQIIQDGIEIQLSTAPIEYVSTMLSESGMAYFTIPQETFTNTSGQITIEALGISKTITILPE
ncbi:hypothetical protein [Dokdonia sp.]|uniref:hypothetical protein n=1 Tax=Dokdonia sp. TaxID=2024995 RepID=UPI003267B99E